MERRPAQQFFLPDQSNLEESFRMETSSQSRFTTQKTNSNSNNNNKNNNNHNHNDSNNNNNNNNSNNSNNN